MGYLIISYIIRYTINYNSHSENGIPGNRDFHRNNFSAYIQYPVFMALQNMAISWRRMPRKTRRLLDYSTFKGGQEVKKISDRGRRHGRPSIKNIGIYFEDQARLGLWGNAPHRKRGGAFSAKTRRTMSYCLLIVLLISPASQGLPIAEVGGKRLLSLLKELSPVAWTTGVSCL